MKNLTACALASLLMACGGGGGGAVAGSSGNDSVVIGGGGGNGQQLSPAIPPAIASFKSIVLEGDSLIANSDFTSWPQSVLARWQVTSVNLAIPGTTTTDMLARYSSSREKFPLIPGLYILNAGTNDYIAGCSSSTTYANLKSLWKLARDYGFRVLAFTVRSWPMDSHCESERMILNNLIKSDATLYDGLIDINAIFPNRDDRGLLFDGIHYSPSANLLVAAAVQSALERLK